MRSSDSRHGHSKRVNAGWWLGDLLRSGGAVVVALGLLISGASMVTLGHGSIALVGSTVVVGAGCVLVLTTVWLDLRHRRARRSQSGRWPRRKPFLAFRQGASDRTPRPREELSEAEFRRLEDEQEAMYQHGNKMDNGPIGPYGSL